MNPYRASPPAGRLERPRRFPWLFVVMVLCITFMAGAGVVSASYRASPKRALPVVCKADREAGRCWDGEHLVYLMPGYGAVRLEGGTYLVGWPK